MKTPVILLKTPSNTSTTEEDPFYTELAHHGYQPIIVSVIEHILVNLAELEAIVEKGPALRFSGVIVTSGRAGGAWLQACEAVCARMSVPEVDWSNTPFYVVGPRTAASLRSPTLLPKLLPDDSHIIGSEQSGSGEKLAHAIISERDKGTLPFDHPLLYLTGDKNTETIPKILTEGGIAFESLQVYETRPSTKIGDDLNKAVVSLSEHIHSHVWIVFFAPSVAGSALPYLHSLFSLPSSNSGEIQSDAPGRLSCRLGAIGPTTAAYLMQTRSERFRVDVVSPSPDAKSLANTIKEFDTGLGSTA